MNEDLQTIEFETPVVEEGGTVSKVTFNHTIVHKDSIVNHMENQRRKDLLIAGLSNSDLALHDDWLAMRKRVTKEEWETGAISARAQAKQDALAKEAIDSVGKSVVD